ASALTAKPSLAVCREAGVLVAHPLLRQTASTGALGTPAKFSPVWKSPLLVAPSPKKTRAATSSRGIRAAQATPTACGIWGPDRGLALATRVGFQNGEPWTLRPLPALRAVPKTW